MKPELPYRPDPKPTRSQWERQQAAREANRGSLILWVGIPLVLGSLFWPYLVWHGTEPNYPYHDTWTHTGEIAEGAWIGFLLVLGFSIVLVRAIGRGWRLRWRSFGGLGVMILGVLGIALLWGASVVLSLLLHMK